ncbi:MAG: glycosyltransferase, partial [Chitinophagaceae bacterium]
EMSPLVIQEAFAAGIPVIGSDVYGNAEQISDNRNGWLFRFQDVNALTEILQTLIRQPEKIGEAKKTISAPKTFAEVASGYEVVYQEILSTA